MITIKCPKCQTDMKSGWVEIKGSLLGFLLVGFSYGHLWFRQLSGKGKIVVHFGGGRAAYNCPACGTIVMLGQA